MDQKASSGTVVVWERNVSESEQVEALTSVRAQKTLKVAKVKRDVSLDRRVQF